MIVGKMSVGLLIGSPLTSIPQFFPGILISSYFSIINSVYSTNKAFLFMLASHPIDENSKQFKFCIDDILRRIKNMVSRR